MEKRIFRHYKGNEYEYVGECLHSETLEEMVIYRALYGEQKTWVRPKAMFFEDVVLPDGKVVKRFEEIKDDADKYFVEAELKRLNQLRKDGVLSNKQYKDQKQILLSYGAKE